MRFGRRGRRVRKVGQRRVVHLQLAVARRQLDAAPRALRSVEVLARCDAAIRFLLAGERVDTGDLPRTRLHVIGCRVAAHALATHGVLAQESGRPYVAITLRSNAPVRAIGYDRAFQRAVSTITEVCLLRSRLVRWEIRRGERAVLAAARDSEAGTEPCERIAVGVLERQREDTREHVLATAIIEVGVPAVDDSVEDADRIGQPLAGEVAVETRAEIAIRRDVCRLAALDEGQF